MSYPPYVPDWGGGGVALTIDRRIRGHGDETDSNFIQLLNLRAIDTPGLGDWMKKKTNKYPSHDIQNQVLHIMALGILRDVSKSISCSGFFSGLADECTDASNKEQLVVCIRWVDELLQDHEYVIGVYNAGTIDAKTLTDALEDVLLWAGLKIHNCCGQCYNGGKYVWIKNWCPITLFAKRTMGSVHPLLWALPQPCCW